MCVLVTAGSTSRVRCVCVCMRVSFCEDRRGVVVSLSGLLARTVCRSRSLSVFRPAVSHLVYACVSRLIHTCEMTHSFACVACRYYDMYAMKHSCVHRDSLRYVPRLVHIGAVTHSYV